MGLQCSRMCEGSELELDIEAAHPTNAEIVELLRSQWPGTGNFFQDSGDRLVVGAKIADQGAQAEIFEAAQCLYRHGDIHLQFCVEGVHGGGGIVPARPPKAMGPGNAPANYVRRWVPTLLFCCSTVWNDGDEWKGCICDGKILG